MVAAMMIVALPFTGMMPRLHVTTMPATEQLPCVDKTTPTELNPSADRSSVTVTAVAWLGPVFATLRVKYCVVALVPPNRLEASNWLMLTSAETEPMVIVSVAELLFGLVSVMLLGGVIVAVLMICWVAPTGSFTGAKMVATAPLLRLS
jgi:hypothetical protein